MPTEHLKPVDVDFAKPLSPIRPLHGSDFGPRYNGNVDLSDYFRAAGFPSLRVHDCPLVCRDTVDIHCVFPLFHLDETDPANWTFRLTDDYLAAIKALGADIIYRLGPSIESQQPKYFIHPPADFEKWARLCCGIIRHYNEGWADGFHHDITYWEIWNEPWNANMWTGSDEEWFRLYEVASKTIQSEFPHLKLGGADALGGKTRKYAEDFLTHCREHDCPMDFFCWHIYARTPKEIIEHAWEAKKLCEEYGFGEAEQNLNEWNWFPEKDWTYRSDPGRNRRFHERLASADAAAFVVATLSFLQDAPMTMANYYAPFLGRWGMFDYWRRPQKPWYAFVAFNAMMETPCRVEATGDDLDTGLSVLAGLDEDARRARVLLSNFADTAVSEIRLTLKGLREGRRRFDAYLLNDALDLQPVKSGVLDAPQDELVLSLPPGSVRLLKIEPA